VILAAKVFVALVAVEHVWFAVLEMVFFARPLGRKVFGTKEAFAKEAAPLAANQGLYNLFLFAAEPLGHALRVFFLACVVVAGLFGGATVSKRIALVQALPAAIGLALALALA
jgi:putative membrane protein